MFCQLCHLFSFVLVCSVSCVTYLVLHHSTSKSVCSGLCRGGGGGGGRGVEGGGGVGGGGEGVAGEGGGGGGGG